MTRGLARRGWFRRALAVPVGLGRSSFAHGPATRAFATRLFAPVPDEPVSPRTALVAACAVAMAAAVSLARQAGAPALDTLWAEDGGIFLEAAVREPALRPLGESYVGYFHTAPRLLAEVAAAMPLSLAAAVMSGGAAVLVGALGALVYRASAGHLRSRGARVVVGASFVLLPIAGVEVLNNMANVHWYLLLASFWVLLWTPRRRWELAAGSAVLVLAGLSDPLALLLAPVAAARALVVRRPAGQVFTAAYSVGVVVQLAAMVVSSARREDLELLRNPARLVHWYGRDVLAQTLLGDRLGLTTGSSSQAEEVLAVTVAVAAVAGGVLLARRRRGSWPAPLAAAAAVASVAFCAAPVALVGHNTSRYAVVPSVLLAAAVAALVDGDEPAVPARWWRGGRAALVMVILVVWTLDLRVGNERSPGPRWAPGLEGARLACAAGAESAQVVPPPELPPDKAHVFVIDLPCTRVQEAASVRARTGSPGGRS